MSATTESERSRTSFWRSSLLMAGSVLLGGLALAPYAITKSGSAGIGGVAIAGAICLAAGLVADGIAHLVGRGVSPLATMLLGMTVRMLPPLGICLFLAAQGARGREQLAFIVYLLAFYLVTLAVETWLSIRRLNVSRITATRVAPKSNTLSQHVG